MKNLLHILFNLAAYYAAGWVVVWIIAVACGAPLDLGNWHEMPRVIVGLFIAPLIGGGLASYIEEKY